MRETKGQQVKSRSQEKKRRTGRLISTSEKNIYTRNSRGFVMRETKGQQVKSRSQEVKRNKKELGDL